MTWDLRLRVLEGLAVGISQSLRIETGIVQERVTMIQEQEACSSGNKDLGSGVSNDCNGERWWLVRSETQRWILLERTQGRKRRL